MLTFMKTVFEPLLSMKTLIGEESSQDQNVRCTPWGEKKHLQLQEPELRWKRQHREEKRQRPPAPAWTQRQPVETESVLCVESGFWDKRNQMKNDESVMAAVK